MENTNKNTGSINSNKNHLLVEDAIFTSNTNTSIKEQATILKAAEPKKRPVESKFLNFKFNENEGELAVIVNRMLYFLAVIFLYCLLFFPIMILKHIVIAN